ncbi:membrane metallo-endopeptidase-like protein 1-like protein, partial [Leptotrombidium deliense]
SHILRSIDNNTHPCNDFYQFACGNWIKNEHIPDDKNSISSFSKVSEELTYKLRDLVEKHSTKDDAPIFKAMRVIYKQCNDEQAIEKIDDTILKKILKQLGGWPVVEGDKWNEAEFDWINVTYKLRDLGYSFDHFISAGVGVDYRKTEDYILSVGEASLLLSREHLMKNLSDHLLVSYYKLMVDSAILMGADAVAAKKEMMEVLKFAKSVAALTTSREESRDASKFYNKMKIEDLSKYTTNIPWKQFFKRTIGKYFNESKPVLVGVPKFLTQIEKLINSVPKRVIANYIFWQTVRSSFIQMGKKWEKLSQEYSKAVTGLEKYPPRWKTCLSLTWSDFGIAMSSLYIREHFGRRSKIAVSQMIYDVHESFINILNQVDWMDQATKQHANEKAKKMRFNVAFPDELLDNSKLAEFYGNIPAGILHFPFFDINVPKYLNYGGIGAVIGHEITHGFDDVGRQFDQNGNNKMWWNNDTDAKFKEKAKCIIDQYGRYTVIDGIKINGINTQGENIADNGGLKEAYFAYKNFERKYGKELQLPGLDYSADQMFFINFAQVGIV